MIAATRRRGYTLITLDEAMRDWAYQRADGYTCNWGPRWIHRWVMADKRPKSFFAGEPLVPKWVLEMAGVEGEVGMLPRQGHLMPWA